MLTIFYVHCTIYSTTLLFFYVLLWVVVLAAAQICLLGTESLIELRVKNSKTSCMRPTVVKQTAKLWFGGMYLPLRASLAPDYTQ